MTAASHVYVHIPFCVRKCPYCDFNSHVGRDGETDVYLDALLEEARRRLAGTEPSTIFVGGGTPTHPEAPQIARVLTELREIVGGRRLEEWTVEANPGSLDAEKVEALVDAGVNRVSLGAQSFDDRVLQILGRAHDAEATPRSVAQLRAGGIERVSLDLILAVPGQTIADQLRDVDRALALEPEHVSAYVLTIEPGTVFERWVKSGRLPEPDTDREAEHLAVVTDRLNAAGLERYEISNHARPGARCLHNLAYWESRPWTGVGAGAHSYDGRRRWKNVDDPAAYVKRIVDAGEAVEWVETPPPSVAAFEGLMMGLRLTDGVDLDALAARVGFDLRSSHAEVIERHLSSGLVTLEGARLRATARGTDLLSYVLRDFLPDDEPILQRHGVQDSGRESPGATLGRV